MIKFIKFNIDDFLLRHAGKFLYITGLLGIIIDVRYDTIAGRAKDACTFGPMQILCIIYCCLLIYVGYIFDSFSKEIK